MSEPPNASVGGSAARLLDSIHGPADVKALPESQLAQLALEIRQELIEVTSANGGHLGPNLGVVELTIALHRVFDTPTDRFVFDVAHQGYVHKLLTGRNGPEFKNIRKTGGLSGFLYRPESEHDCYGAGHAGTALSAALGMAVARDLNGGDEHVVALCGDAAFTCGITMEALNNIASSTRRLIVILNDNEWSIARNVGAISRYLNELSTNPTYNRIYHDLEGFFKGLPHGEAMNRMWVRWKQETKDFFVSSSLFEKFGLRYLGPIDGHDIPLLLKNLDFARHSDTPVIIHVLTKKGRGYDAALGHPEKFHGTSPFEVATGIGKASAPTPPNYQDVFGDALVRFATADASVVGITGAMPSGTGLNHLASALPRQFFDVGIAEEHAVLFAAGLATRGIKPVVAIYSTFLQRAVDPIIHDVCLQNLPVVFCMDRAGLSPNDGPTHHGLFDIAYLRCVPNAVVMQPKDEDELVDMLHTSIVHNGPAFIRYPRGQGTGVAIKEEPATMPIGKAELVRDGHDMMIWALGPWVADAVVLADRLATEDGLSVGVVNARWAKPIDRDMLLGHAAAVPLIVTMEDHVLSGGFGSAVIEALQDADMQVPVERIGWPDSFVEHGSSIDILRAAYGLSPDAIAERVRERYRRIRSAPVETVEPG
ncbi:MAG TPA: 1-deoxy-D-xylulose-5-phosphate synthase [Opitutaceae bacterium]|nr:1-deoxy-D-xylulose-5-phosphate synthase [Opitutaceae bacterium]